MCWGEGEGVWLFVLFCCKQSNIEVLKDVKTSVWISSAVTTIAVGTHATAHLCLERHSLNCKEMVRNSQSHTLGWEKFYCCSHNPGHWPSPMASCGWSGSSAAVKGLTLMERRKAGVLLGSANLQPDICQLCKQRSRIEACPNKQAIFSA